MRSKPVLWMCAKTFSTRPGEGTTPKQTDNLQYHKCLCRYQQVFHPEFAMPSSACGAGVRKNFVNFSGFVIIVCLDVCISVGGRCLSLPFGWAHMSEGLLPSTELFHHPSIPCFQRGGDVGELPLPLLLPLLLRPSLSPSNRAVWSGTWEWKQERNRVAERRECWGRD